MARTVADVMWAMLAKAGVKRCYGIIGDALNPTIDALRRDGKIEFIHVRHEEYGVFAAVADAYLTGHPVAVCGTAGPGVTHLFNGLMDARKEGAPVIAIAGDVETSVIDTSALEELNPYKFFDTACLYVGRLVNPEQVRPVVTTAIGGALEIVDATCGILVPPQSPLLLADALRGLIENGPRRRALGAAGPAKAASLADPETSIRRLESILRANLAIPTRSAKAS